MNLTRAYEVWPQTVFVDDTTRYTPARLANHWDALQNFINNRKRKKYPLFYIVNIYIYTYLILSFIHSLLTFLFFYTTS
jgi:hypothetical protein